VSTFAPVLRYPATDRLPGERSAASASRHGLRLTLWSVAIVVLVHWFLLTAGHLVVWPQYTARTDLLSRAFARGQLHLLIKPDPRLSQLPDPYDPVANAAYRYRPGVPDSCLYDGRLYLYWGPAPALMMVPVRLVVGPDVMIGDHYPAFAFSIGLIAATAALLTRACRRHFPAAPAWLPAAGVLVAGFSTPITCMMTRAAVYEVAILGGQCFLLWGIYCAWRGSDSPQSAGRASRSLMLVLAGSCLALAVGCRVSLAIAVGVVSLLTTARLLWQQSAEQTFRGRVVRALLPVALMALPLFAGALAMGWYNHARFGHWAEFGQKYQLAGANLRSYPSLFSVQNIAPGLWSYFLRPVATVDRFPYLLPVTGDGSFPDFIPRLPHYETYEAITGLVWVFPLLWIVPALALGLVKQTWRSRKAAAPSAGDSADTAQPADITWLQWAILSAGVLGFAPVLMMIGSTQRYLADLTPPLAVAATLWFATKMARPAPIDDLADDLNDELPRRGRDPRRLAGAVFVSLGLMTIGIGLLVCVEGYSAHFRMNNRPLFDQLCPQGIGVAAPADQHPTAQSSS
jgi:hypothetical protein